MWTNAELPGIGFGRVWFGIFLPHLIVYRTHGHISLSGSLLPRVFYFKR